MMMQDDATGKTMGSMGAINNELSAVVVQRDPKGCKHRAALES
jgi:hypothetical protein